MKDYSEANHLRFVVINLDKGKKYPINFVCILPKEIGYKKDTTFEKIFGDQSLEVAKRILSNALESEDDAEVREEIEKRLTFLNPNSMLHRVCVSCGKRFKIDSEKKFKQKCCEDCINRNSQFVSERMVYQKTVNHKIRYN